MSEIVGVDSMYVYSKSACGLTFSHPWREIVREKINKSNYRNYKKLWKRTINFIICVNRIRNLK